MKAYNRCRECGKLILIKPSRYKWKDGNVVCKRVICRDCMEKSYIEEDFEIDNLFSLKILKDETTRGRYAVLVCTDETFRITSKRTYEEAMKYVIHRMKKIKQNVDNLLEPWEEVQRKAEQKKWEALNKKYVPKVGHYVEYQPMHGNQPRGRSKNVMIIKVLGPDSFLTNYKGKVIKRKEIMCQNLNVF